MATLDLAVRDRDEAEEPPPALFPAVMMELRGGAGANQHGPLRQYSPQNVRANVTT